MSFILRIVNALFQAAELLVVARAILSWVPHDKNRPPFDLLYRITDPLILTCREILYSIFRLLGADERRMPFDFSPLLALGLLYIVQRAVIMLLLLAAH